MMQKETAWMSSLKKVKFGEEEVWHGMFYGNQEEVQRKECRQVGIAEQLVWCNSSGSGDKG